MYRYHFTLYKNAVYLSFSLAHSVHAVCTFFIFATRINFIYEMSMTLMTLKIIATRRWISFVSFAAHSGIWPLTKTKTNKNASELKTNERRNKNCWRFIATSFRCFDHFVTSYAGWCGSNKKNSNISKLKMVGMPIVDSTKHDEESNERKTIKKNAENCLDIKWNDERLLLVLFHDVIPAPTSLSIHVLQKLFHRKWFFFAFFVRKRRDTFEYLKHKNK